MSGQTSITGRTNLFTHVSLRTLPGVGLLRQLARKPLGFVSLIIIVAVIVMAALAAQISPYDPLETHAADRLQGPSSQYLLGTDQIGRDDLSRIIYGARISLLVGLISVGVATVCGSAIGLVSGYVGGALDMVTQRVVDALQSFPGLILALALMSVFGSGVVQVTVAIAIVIAPSEARVVRGAVLAVKENLYIEAARALGANSARLIVRHILPNVMAPILILASTTLGLAILVEGALSFLGLGTPPPTASWGNMLAGNGRAYLERAPTLSLFPGIVLSLTVLAFNLLGDTLRDIWDPRLRGVR